MIFERYPLYTYTYTYEGESWDKGEKYKMIIVTKWSDDIPDAKEIGHKVFYLKCEYALIEELVESLGGAEGLYEHKQYEKIEIGMRNVRVYVVNYSNHRRYRHTEVFLTLGGARRYIDREIEGVSKLSGFSDLLKIQDKELETIYSASLRNYTGSIWYKWNILECIIR